MKIKCQLCIRHREGRPTYCWRALICGGILVYVYTDTYKWNRKVAIELATKLSALGYNRHNLRFIHPWSKEGKR